jgi:hypothetical protein
MNLSELRHARPAGRIRFGTWVAKLFGLGIVFTFLLVFPAGIEAHPVLWLGRVGAAQLVAAGFMAGLVTAVGCCIMLGSYVNFIAAFLKPEAKHHFFGTGIYLFLVCLIWGVNTYFAADVLMRATARTDTLVDAQFAGVSRTKGCRDLANFTTASGTVDVCMPNGRQGFQPKIAVPGGLKPGDTVTLKGRSNGFAFVVDSVMRRR